MPLIGNSKQNKEKNLEDFYLDLTKDKSNPVWLKIGLDMLAFIKMINETFKETAIWGLTSHSRLVLQTKDKWDAEWFVIVYCIGTSNWRAHIARDIETSPFKRLFRSIGASTYKNRGAQLRIDDYNNLKGAL